MSDRLPSLNLLRVFEAAGRQLSFKHAAKELNVTPSAVSHQIKSLEDDLGFLLFRRLNRALVLTPAGKAYLDVVQQAFAVLRSGSQQVERRFGKPVIRISVIPFMANEVLIPNLIAFQQAHPDVELRMEVTSNFRDFSVEDVDLEVRFGLGEWPGLEAEKLLDIQGSPVCSPAFLEQHPLAEHQDLVGKPLITLGQEPSAWQRWADHVELTNFKPTSSLQMDNLLAHYHAVQEGLGVGIGIFPLVDLLIINGKLIAPFAERVPIEESYFIVNRPGEKERPEIAAFIDWLHKIFNDLKDLDGLG